MFCHLTVGKSGESKASPPGHSAKLCYTPRKFQGQKPRPMEIPHDSF